MKFEKTLTSRASVKKQKHYIFDFSEEDIEKGLKATYDKPHFCKAEKGTTLFALYKWEGHLYTVMYHSYDKFRRIEKKG